MAEGKESHDPNGVDGVGVDKAPEDQRDTERERPPESGKRQDTAPDVDGAQERANEVIARAMELIERQQRSIEEMERRLEAYDVGQLRRLEERVEELTDRLPKTVRDEKAQIKGYYDFEGATRKYANEATEADYREAKANLDSLLKGSFNG